MKKEHKSILISLIIGDGCLYVKKDLRFANSWHSKLIIKHSVKQLEFLNYKVSLLHSIFGGKHPDIVNINNNGFPGIVATKSNKYFRVLKKFIYKNGKKNITKNILNFLTPQGLAIWYMDDGNLSLKKRDGKVHARELFLNTHLSVEENQVIIDYFSEKWGINFTQVKNNGLYRLRCGTKEAAKFIEIIKPYIVPSMLYKIDMKY